MFIQFLGYIIKPKLIANFVTFLRFPNSKKPEEAAGKNLVDSLGEQSPKTSSRIVHDSTKSEPEKVQVKTFNSLNAVILSGSSTSSQQQPTFNIKPAAKPPTNDKTLQVYQSGINPYFSIKYFQALRVSIKGR